MYEDRECYDVTAEVVVTNPARPERGMVRIADDGTIRWECDYDQIPDGAIAVADTTATVWNRFAKPRNLGPGGKLIQVET